MSEGKTEVKVSAGGEPDAAPPAAAAAATKPRHTIADAEEDDEHYDVPVNVPVPRDYSRATAIGVFGLATAGSSSLALVFLIVSVVAYDTVDAEQHVRTAGIASVGSFVCLTGAFMFATRYWLSDIMSAATVAQGRSTEFMRQMLWWFIALHLSLFILLVTLVIGSEIISNILAGFIGVVFSLLFCVLVCARGRMRRGNMLKLDPDILELNLAAVPKLPA